MKTMKKMMLGLVALSIAFQSVVSAADATSSVRLCADEARSSGGISRARFFYQRVRELPGSQATVEFGNQESEQDLIELFSAQQTHKVAKTSILPGVRKILEILTKEMTDFAQDAATSREVVIRIEFPAKSQLEVRSTSEVSKPSKDVVAKFVFKKTAAVAKKAAAMTVEVTTFGFSDKMPPHLLNLFKALLLDDSFAQKYGMICVGSAVALVLVGVVTCAVVKTKRSRTQQSLDVFDGLAQKMCQSFLLPGAGGGLVAAAGDYAADDVPEPKALAVDLKTSSLLGPVPVTEFKYDKAQHEDKDLIVATVFFEGQLGQLAESLKWPFVGPSEKTHDRGPQERKLIVPCNLVPTDPKELKRIAACLTYGRWELIVVDACEKMPSTKIADFLGDGRIFVESHNATKAPGEYFSRCSLLGVVFEEVDGQSASLQKSSLQLGGMINYCRHDRVDKAVKSTEMVRTWPAHQKPTFEEKQHAIVAGLNAAIAYEDDVYVERNQFEWIGACLNGWDCAARFDELLKTNQSRFDGRAFVVEWQDEVMREVILCNADKWKNTIVVFTLDAVGGDVIAANFDIDKECSGLLNVLVVEPCSGARGAQYNYKQKKFGEVSKGLSAAVHLEDIRRTVTEWSQEIVLRLCPVLGNDFFKEHSDDDFASPSVLPRKPAAASRRGIICVASPSSCVTPERITEKLAQKLQEERIDGVQSIGSRRLSENILFFKKSAGGASESGEASGGWRSPAGGRDFINFVEIAVRCSQEEVTFEFLGESPLIQILLLREGGFKVIREKDFNFNDKDPLVKTLFDKITDQMIEDVVREIF